MRKVASLIICLFITFSAKSQELSNLRHKSLFVLNDTIVLDTLSIIPGSEIIVNANNSYISNSDYRIDNSRGLLIPSQSLLQKNSSIKITYRVFPINFSESFYHRNKEETIITGPVLSKTNIPSKTNESIFFSDNILNKQGSITRGITIGNNQDAVINSNLNLQMSGKISNDMYILAAISDENIPIQPDGNSQQIQDFDKVFIQLYNHKTKLIAGDFEISKPQGYFMNINRKAQGGLLNTKFTGKKEKTKSLETTISGAITKGKYCRKTFQGQEGNQGPYKLTGCENEQYIIVLAGTEKVYINGKLLTRGKENDYVIDYNTGELTFTANKTITKDSRIAVEFEYSERSYARFLIFNTNEFKTKNGHFWLNIYSEQDSKNQAINQDLTQEQKQILSESGDYITNAYVPNVDSVEFRNDYVLYEKKDTSVNNINYEIYEYSTNPELAFYQIGFNLVGENKGNYVQIQNSANGKVFEWIAPVSGIPQGNYEPVRLLIAPKKQQMISFGGNIMMNNNSTSYFEFALSNHDINTFSSKNSSDNIGYGLKFGLNQQLLHADTLKNQLTAKLSYLLVNKHFTEIERYRSVEFEREWNIQYPFTANEHNAGIDLEYKHKRFLNGSYGFDLLSAGDEYTGYKHKLYTSLNKHGYSLNFNSSLLNSESKLNNTEFIRYITNVSKSFSPIKIGVESEFEQNKWNNNITDSLTNNSFSFSSYRIYLENPDSTINKYSLSYTLRNDYLPINNKLKQATKAEDFQIGFGLLKNPSNILKALVTYRKLEVIDTTIIKKHEENTITGRIDYNFRIFKGAISSLTFYEAGSGLEPKKEYSYLKVTSGQGVYNWEDYNNNGIVELDEFEIAQFQDQANYIRIYTPGSEYIKTYKNEFSQVFNIRPEMIWRSKKGFKNVLSRFSNSTAYQVNQKSTDEILEHSLNPFYSLSNDSTIINLSQNIRNTLSFNRTSTKFGIDYIYQTNDNKILLSNGFDSRKKTIHGLRLRWQFLSDFTIQNYYEIGKKKYSSEFFSTKNYHLETASNEVKIQYQPGFKTKIELNYTYSEKDNILSTEKSFSNIIGTEINYAVAKKGNLLTQGNYVNIRYNSDPNTSIAYEMLKGLKPGNNATWSFMFQWKLAKYLEMNIIYNGRISENINAIHTGSLQLRAFF